MQHQTIAYYQSIIRRLKQGETLSETEKRDLETLARSALAEIQVFLAAAY